jgi:hypothetical protein
VLYIILSEGSGTPVPGPSIPKQVNRGRDLRLQARRNSSSMSWSGCELARTSSTTWWVKHERRVQEWAALLCAWIVPQPGHCPSPAVQDTVLARDDSEIVAVHWTARGTSTAPFRDLPATNRASVLSGVSLFIFDEPADKVKEIIVYRQANEASPPNQPAPRASADAPTCRPSQRCAGGARRKRRSRTWCTREAHPHLTRRWW